MTSFIFTPGGNSWKAGSRPHIIKATPQPFNHRDVCPPALRLGDMEVGCPLPKQEGGRSKALYSLTLAPAGFLLPLTLAAPSN